MTELTVTMAGNASYVRLPRRIFLQLFVEYDQEATKIEDKIKRYERRGNKATAMLWKIRLVRMLEYIKQIETVTGGTRQELRQAAITEFMEQFELRRSFGEMNPT